MATESELKRATQLIRVLQQPGRTAGEYAAAGNLLVALATRVASRGEAPVPRTFGHRKLDVYL